MKCSKDYRHLNLWDTPVSPGCERVKTYKVFVFEYGFFIHGLLD